MNVNSSHQTSWLGEIEPMEPILICQALTEIETMHHASGPPFQVRMTCDATWHAPHGGVRWV